MTTDGLGDWAAIDEQESDMEELLRRITAIEAGLATLLNTLNEFVPLARRAQAMMDSPAMKVKEALLGGSRIRR